jgi:DNA-binding Lrp family transcriptional regulator
MSNAMGRESKFMRELSKKDFELIRQIQDDLPHDIEPFQRIAERLGWTEEEVINRIKEWMDQGIIKRFGALVKHQNVGFKGNAMVAWSIVPSEVERIGRQMAKYPFISHCYERPATSNWPYNLYTMFHASDENEIKAMVKKAAEETGVNDYQVLYSVKEWKKKSMKYV